MVHVLTRSRHPVRNEVDSQLHFQFVDGLSIHVSVFKAADYQGDIIETDEALAEWFDLDAIPYDQMWQDDIHWIPLMLANTPFTGFFTFDGETMLDHKLETP